MWARGARGVRRGVAVVAAGIALACVAAPAFAQGANCDRADLQTIVDAYLATQAAGDPIKLPLADWTQYSEQMEIGTLFGGILAQPLKIDRSMSLLDTTQCQTFTEVIAADNPHPYVIGTRLQFSGKFNPIAPSRVNDLETIVTDHDDWLFNAKKTLAFAKTEDWGEIPEGQRDSRATIIAAANAYLDLFNDKKVVVPWGSPCARLEGGLYTGKGAADDRCDVGIPSGVKLTERKYIVDESKGAVAVLLLFGGKAPDVHMFRVEKGRIRYVHTMTVCATPNCGLTIPDDLKKRLAD